MPPRLSERIILTYRPQGWEGTGVSRRLGHDRTMAYLHAFSQLARRTPWVRLALAPAIALKHQLRRNAHAQEDRFVDRLASMLAEDPCLDVEEFGGRFYLDSRSRLFARLVASGEYEPALTAACRSHVNPARDALDIGSNIGFHAVLFASLVGSGKVLAVEPTEAAHRRLLRNLALNGVENKVIVFKGVASDTPGAEEIRSIAGKEEFATIGALAHPSVQGFDHVTERVAARTVDQLVDEHGLNPGFIKIDVEGVEHRVLRGAVSTLARCRPVIVAELSDPLLRQNGSSAAEVIALLRGLGYDVTDPVDGGLPAGTREYGDILCLPR